MDELENIISGIRESYNHSNIIDIDLGEIIEGNPETRIGYILQHLDPESQREYAINFDPVETLFLDKLVSEEVLEHRIIIDKKDFFRGIVFLDYFTNIIAGDYGILDEVYQVAQDLERMDAELDPDLEVVVKHTGTSYLSLMGTRVREANRKSLDRYRRMNRGYDADFMNLRKVSSVYEALGAMVYALPKNEAIKEKLQGMNALYDIKAAIFVDAVIGCLHYEEYKDKIIELFSHGEYFKSSMVAINLLSKEISDERLEGYIQEML